jgi:biotin synthase
MTHSSMKNDSHEITALLAMPLLELLALANETRIKFCEPGLDICTIVNAKSGRCSQDCKFCAQSGRYQTNASTYPLLPESAILDAALQAEDTGARRFGIVTSGHSNSPQELQQICQVVSKIKSQTRLEVCASLGILSESDLSLLHQAGLSRFHHNIETAPSFYPHICTSHDFEDRVQTIHNARHASLEVCSGGIIGMGESWQERIEMFLALKDLKVQSVPLNILLPIPGTPLASAAPLPAVEIIRAIAIARIILKSPDIKIAAGRETLLKDFQGLGFLAGANGMIIGGYLTLKGREVQDDQKLIRDVLKIWQNQLKADFTCFQG